MFLTLLLSITITPLGKEIAELLAKIKKRLGK